MNKTLIFALIAASLTSQAYAANWLPANGNDLVAQRALALPVPAGDFERKPVHFAWGLDPHAELRNAERFTAESREYWMQADAGELRRGLDIETTSPGALIRLSPADHQARVDLSMVRLSRGGEAIDARKAFAQSAGESQLREAGMDVSAGTAVLRLEPALGQGRFRLQLDQARGRYLVHVYEPDSPYRLDARANRANLLAGNRLEVTVAMRKADRPIATAELQGQLISPAGANYELRVTRAPDGSYSASATVPDEARSAPGLWEVQLLAGSVEGGRRIQRDVRTAVAIAQPTAKLANGYSFDSASLRLTVPLQVGSTGRYQVGATLYATGSDGIARPVSQAHGAAWLDAGSRQLSLAFDRAHVPGGYGAPYEVRFLELKDQTRLGTLETRERAARIAD
ncbi:DUF4785 domain-containing protein [Arenimonas sp.]|uniref:DUF4785 domain-containing protein n=1 Tax=Arenimonas sp. TaxID=1872635 RepID=UPI0039E717F1